MLIFEQSKPHRKAPSQAPEANASEAEIPSALLRTNPPRLPEVSELQAVRHFTRLSRKNFSIDTHFYPLGSCTMKYNPHICHQVSTLGGLLNSHPHQPQELSQGIMACLYELQESLTAITGMSAVSLTPAAGAQGEFAGVAMIRAYHDSRQDYARTEIIIPDAAHGTNPATAVMCGYKVKEIPTNAEGDVDIAALKTIVGPQTAGIMLTNPSTLGVFERRIKEIAGIIHDAGGLLYYDGANLNAILGKVRPGDMGFDVIHVNLHKTFGTPHGGGGPGAGPVGVSARLEPFLPTPIISLEAGKYRWVTHHERPQSIGRLSAFSGNVGIMIRAWVYIRLLGFEGMKRVAEFSTLNANYMMKRLQDEGFQIAFTQRRASHEFVLTLKKETRQTGINAMLFAKNLLDHGFHAPTTYFPLLIPECFLIEPTETESKEEMDQFIDAMIKIRDTASSNADQAAMAPVTLPVMRLDDVKAARELDLVWAES